MCAMEGGIMADLHRIILHCPCSECPSANFQCDSLLGSVKKESSKLRYSVISAY